jgi:CheY-like chemotaxis protein
MSAKRALVVDDSKSARAFLARVLERHEIEVDSAESAEAAIEYLARNKPDVIFMDHMMPGMDGFQAVQSIKNNPRTAAIPILMYTSQEGDLYAGQARALGAAGVLPKQIKQADVTRLLFQLRLVEDRRGEEQSAFARMTPGEALLPANESAIIVAPRLDTLPEVQVSGPVVPAGGEIAPVLPQLSLEIRSAVDATLQKELGALRTHIAATLDAHADRLLGDLAAAESPVRAPLTATDASLPARRRWPAIVAGILACVTTAGAAFLSWMWWQQEKEVAALRTDLAAAYAEVEELRARPPVVVSIPAAPPSDPLAAELAADPLADGGMPAATADATIEAAAGSEATLPAADVVPEAVLEPADAGASPTPLPSAATAPTLPAQ